MQEKHQASQSSTEDQSSGFEQPRTRRRRLHLSSRSRLIAALVVFVAATIVALIQPPWHNSLQPPEKLSTDWAIYPIERNAFARLPVITGSLEEVFVSPNGERIWAVGAGGLVLHSLDGGRTWTQQQSIAVTGPSPELSLEQTQQPKRDLGDISERVRKIRPSYWALMKQRWTTRRASLTTWGPTSSIRLSWCWLTRRSSTAEFGTGHTALQI